DCFVLGSMAGVPYRQQSVRLVQGDMLFLYTKGLSEAENRDRIQYSYGHMHMRLNQALGETYELSDILGVMTRDVEEFLGGERAKQDMTMLLLRYLGT
ncbi:MAG: SpoIIE family protein phosphatase, partial [Lachnospiraceae bacterium]|nr:SpoIIE family protein phosphatase [Lachnospiraceae bacterium]